jgi:3-dehydroquinate synthase
MNPEIASPVPQTPPTHLCQPFQVQWQHRLYFAQNVFSLTSSVLPDVIAFDPLPARVLVVVDQGLLNAQPQYLDEIIRFFQHHTAALTLAGPIIQIPSGELCKNDRRYFDLLCQALHDARLDRHSYVLVIGGGAVLDLTGFAAAIVHRGVRLIRIPSTTLAQADSGVGVKNGINAFGQKNFLGTFSPPWAVINDEALLPTLPHHHWISGFSEAVKVALLKDSAFFDQIQHHAPAIAQRHMPPAVAIIRRAAELHLRHITQGGDPFELTRARPLDFGHWSAHKLESLSRFSLPHGHAVAIGLALDLVYSELIGLCTPPLANQVIACLKTLGLPVWHELLTHTEPLLEGLEEFREHLGGQLTITLVRNPGESLDVHEMDQSAILRAVQKLAEIAST